MAELLVAPLLNGHRAVGAVTFRTSRALGFTVGEREVSRRIVPTLFNACELRLLRRTKTTLSNTYVGQSTGERIVAGNIQRGDVDSLMAALLLSDEACLAKVSKPTNGMGANIALHHGEVSYGNIGSDPRLDSF